MHMTIPMLRWISGVITRPSQSPFDKLSMTSGLQRGLTSQLAGRSMTSKTKARVPAAKNLPPALDATQQPLIAKLASSRESW